MSNPLRLIRMFNENSNSITGGGRILTKRIYGQIYIFGICTQKHNLV